MSESYDYLKERVAELAFEIKRKDEVLAWDADKILECTTKIVEKNKHIATLDVRVEIGARMARELQDFVDDAIEAVEGGYQEDPLTVVQALLKEWEEAHKEAKT